MRRHKPEHEDVDELKAYFYSAALNSKEGKRLKGFLRQPGEPLEQYMQRINLFTMADDLLDQKTQGSEGLWIKEDQRIKGLIEGIANKMLELRKEFLRVANICHPEKLKEILDTGFPINYQDPRTGETALHMAAGSKGRPALRVLLQYDDIDFLVRDNQGRLASELAYLYSHDPAMARLLGNKEREQADAQGIKLTRRPRP